ncbi:hypothetical protein OMCYN_01652 [cyanobiont of Ornithocercus magnificus]|nr:hypothetical protein OMCYN_01652 [cyanobiont of Ornithocercus magnificus]
MVDPYTELSAVNAVLLAIGQPPATAADLAKNSKSSEIQTILNLLDTCCADAQSEGWSINRTQQLSFAANNECIINGIKPHNLLGINILAINGERDISQQSDKLALRLTTDADTNTDKYAICDRATNLITFTKNLDLEVSYIWSLMALPSVFRSWVVKMATSRAALHLVGSPQLVAILRQEEATARAACLDYECRHQQPHHAAAWRLWSYPAIH